MTTFWQTYDRITKDALSSEVGKLMTAAGFHTAHTGGGCMCWEHVLQDNSYLWVCDTGNDLGTSLDEEYLVGFYDKDGNDVAYDTVPSLTSAIAWCKTKM